jgi:lysophospholipase L1-like esterase
MVSHPCLHPLRKVPLVRRSVAINSLLAALVTVAASLAWPSSAGAIPPPRLYVALGDSFTAAPLTSTPTGSPAGCLRSNNNYPSVARPSIGMEIFKDVSCSGAKTDDFFAPQSVTGGTNPPQLDALTTMAFEVSIGVGGNDIGFSSIIENCVSANPFETPCRDEYTAGGVDILAQRIAATAPKIAAVIQAVRARAPYANIRIVGYPSIVPDSGSGCWPRVPISWGDVGYLRSTHKRLNSMLAQQAAANGARYVDTYTPSIGRDTCASSGTRWVEGPIPSNAAAPFHPNARGSAGMAAALVATR